MRQVINMGDRESNPSHAVLETNSPALEHAPIQGRFPHHRPARCALLPAQGARVGRGNFA